MISRNCAGIVVMLVRIRVMDLIWAVALGVDRMIRAVAGLAGVKVVRVAVVRGWGRVVRMIVALEWDKAARVVVDLVWVKETMA